MRQCCKGSKDSACPRGHVHFECQLAGPHHSLDSHATALPGSRSGLGPLLSFTGSSALPSLHRVVLLECFAQFDFAQFPWADSSSAGPVNTAHVESPSFCCALVPLQVDTGFPSRCLVDISVAVSQVTPQHIQAHPTAGRKYFWLCDQLRLGFPAGSATWCPVEP